MTLHSCVLSCQGAVQSSLSVRTSPTIHTCIFKIFARDAAHKNADPTRPGPQPICTAGSLHAIRSDNEPPIRRARARLNSRNAGKITPQRMWLTLFVAYGRVERGRSTANRPPPASPSRARSGRKKKFLPPLPKEAICISCTIHCLGLNVRSASNNPQYTTRYSHTLLAGIGVPEGGGAGAAGRPRRRGAERSCRL